MAEPFDPLDREAMYHQAVRNTPIERSADLQLMASEELMDWFQEHQLERLGQIADYCLTAQSDPTRQAELLCFSADDRRAIAKILNKVEPERGRPMMLFLLDAPGQNPGHDAD